jgi:hypothetical protein
MFRLQTKIQAGIAQSYPGSTTLNGGFMERVIYAGMTDFKLKEDATPESFNQALQDSYGTDDQEQVNFLLFLIESTSSPLVMYGLPIDINDAERRERPAILSGLKFLMACMTEYLTGDELFILAKKHLPKEEEFIQLLVSNSKKKESDLVFSPPAVGKPMKLEDEPDSDDRK